MADQGSRGNLPPIQSFVSQHSNTTAPDGFDGDFVSQQSPHILDNINDQTDINSFALFPTNNDSGECQEYPAFEGFDHQYDTPTLKKIQIKYQPRSNYHPRTYKENERVPLYIRCDGDELEDYPTIYTFQEWRSRSRDTIVEVALVDKDEQLHPYTIDNKERHLPDNHTLIWRVDENIKSVLYFRLTDNDFDKGYKAFKIALIKSKQDDIITKQLIDERQLEKSKLRFKLYYLDENGSYRWDEDSMVYSCVMTEKYGDVSVQHVNPQFGPMRGNELLDIVFSGLKAGDKKQLTFEISEQAKGLTYKIPEFDSNGNVIHFSMPASPYIQEDSVLVNIVTLYEGRPIHKSPYIYVAGLDGVLDRFNMNKSNQLDVNPTTSNSCNNSNQDPTSSNSSSSSTTSKKSSKKRLRKN